MEPPRLVFTAITDIADPLLSDCLALYETAFPPAERLLIATILRLLKDYGGDAGRPHHLVAMQHTSGDFAGMMMYQARPEDGFALLWYLAIQPSERGQGLGSLAYEEVIRRLDPETYEAMFFEVEIPRGRNAGEARRRIAFYRRQGALLLEGIHYVQHVGWHQPPIPMHLMVHPLRPLDAVAAYELAAQAFGQAVEKRGRLRLN